MAADKLIFPIGFDLEKAVADAEGQADKLLRRLETTIRSHPLAVNLKITNAGSGSINEINARMKEIVKEWNNLTEAERIGSKTSGEYTDRAKKLISEFTRLTGATESYARGLQQITAAARKAANEQERNLEKQRKTEAILKAQENTIANITAKLQHYKKEMNSAEMGSKQFRKAAEEVKRLSHNLTEAQRRVNALTDNFKNQDGYVSRLVKRLAVYAGYQQFTNFITSVREVTAEFELQRISLGAIIQDQAKANQLFSEIKQFALKSPVKILDLTKYTKQLAAYKFETKDLFDWTKRLTDISVGLGVSMDRIILLAGQIRATGYLRGSEVRQATEAGIPLVEELAKKLEELNGRAYTTAEVMNLISERAISWEMVADVFKDMTSAGGMFFDIQEKQGNTLYGMWQKLGDAASVMYEEIGNTKSINDGMKNLISTLRMLMLNWKQTGAALATVGVAVLLYINRVRLAEKVVELSIIAESKSVLALKSKQAALTRLIAIQRASTGSVKADTVATKAWTLAKIRGYQALNLFTAAVKGLWAALAKNIWGIAILGLSLLVEKLWLAEDATEKLKNKLSDIKLDYEVKQGQDASNFEYLANAAVEAAKGSKAQKDALEELKNTYGKIIPLELLTIENLERMKGNYGELIALIDEYNLKQKYEAETSAIEESFAPEQEKRAGVIREKLRKGLRLDYADEETGGVFDKVLDLSERNIQRFLLNLNKYAEEGMSKGEQIIAASKDLAKELGLNESETQALIDAMWELDRGEFEGQGTLMDYTEGLQRKHEALSVVNEDYDKAKKKLNEFSSIVDNVMKKNEDEPEVTTYDNVIENEKARLNNQVGDVANGIIELFKTANAEVDSGTQQLLQTVVTNGGMIPSTVWDLLEKTAENLNNPKLLAAIQSLRGHYQKIAPDNETVNFVRSGFIKIVNAAKGNMQEYRQYLYDGSMTIKEYQDFLQKSIQKSKEQAFEMIRVNALIDAGLVDGQKYDEATINALQNRADNLQAILDQYVTPLIMPDDKKSKSGGTKSDDRLSKLQEILSTLEKINTKYEELRKKEGDTKALEDIQKMYANTLEYANKIAQSKPFAKFGLQFKMPTQFSTLQEYRKAILDIINTLKMKGYEKAALDLEEKIGTGDIDKLQEKIEKNLKQLADRISRTKTAKEFYDKILSQTGDIELAAHVTLSLYGDTGEGLFDATVKQIQEIFKSNNPDVKIDLSSVIDTTNQRINYGALAKLYEQYQDVISKANRSTAEKIISEGQKVAASNISTWEKELAKAKSFEEQRTDIINRETQRRAEIIKSFDYTPEQKRQKIEQSERIQKEEIYKIDVEEFKAGDDYLKIFEDIEQVATSSLNRIETELKKLMESGKDLDATNLKVYADALQKIQDEKEKRDPLKTITNGVRDYIDAIKERKQAETELKTAQVEYDRQMPIIKTQIDTASQDKITADADVLLAQQQLLDIQQRMSELRAKEIIDETSLAVLMQQENVAQNNLTFAMMRQNNAASRLTEAERMRVSLNKKLQSRQKKVTNAQDKQKKSVKSLADGLNQASANVGAMSDTLSAVKDLLGDAAADGTVLGGAIDGGIKALETFQKLMGVIIALQTIYNIVTESNPWIAIAAAVLAVAGILTGAIQASKIKAANEEIENQQNLLDRLEYTYGRLEKAMEKAFGVDYIANYNRRIKVLNAQAEAYLKQAEAERSKGKKADEDKIKQFEEGWRDALDEIADMQGQIAAQMLGTDLTSAARDFAKAWLDAYKEFGNTADAMSEKFHEMIENMIVESLLARIMEKALQPAFKMIDEYNGDFMDAGFWKEVSALAAQGAEDANYGAQTMMKFLEQAGVNIRDLGGDLTGISRDIATASEESINGLSAHMNTVEYYVAQIHHNVAAMAMRGLDNMPESLPAVDYTPLIQQSLENQSMLVRNTAEAVVECRRSAVAAEATLAEIRRVIVPRGNKGTHYVYVGM